MSHAREQRYTMAEIRDAFWKTFHEQGEIWFDYLSSAKKNEHSTTLHWSDFRDALIGYEETGLCAEDEERIG